MSEVEITFRGGDKGRGFQQYGNPVPTAYGELVEVYESSAASGPHCWLRIYGGPEIPKNNLAGSGPEHGVAAHLTFDQAKAIRDRLDAFIRDTPRRWVAPWGRPDLQPGQTELECGCIEPSWQEQDTGWTHPNCILHNPLDTEEVE